MGLNSKLCTSIAFPFPPPQSLGRIANRHAIYIYIALCFLRELEMASCSAVLANNIVLLLSHGFVTIWVVNKGQAEKSAFYVHHHYLLH